MSKKQQADNLRYWEALGKTDPKHTKPFKRSGGFTGTAIKPIWIVQMLTRQFGPIGEGWGMGKPEFQVVPVPDAGKVMVYCTVECWHTDRNNTFYGVGGDTVQDQFKHGRTVADDEAFKKAYTDAIGNAFKFLGVGADVHMGQFDDSKYVQQVAEQFADDGFEEQADVIIEMFAKAKDKDELESIRHTNNAFLQEIKRAKPRPKSLDRIANAYKLALDRIEGGDKSKREGRAE